MAEYRGEITRAKRAIGDATRSLSQEPLSKNRHSIASAIGSVHFAHQALVVALGQLCGGVDVAAARHPHQLARGLDALANALGPHMVDSKELLRQSARLLRTLSSFTRQQEKDPTCVLCDAGEPHEH